MTAQECESLIMTARVKAGWITEEDLNPPAEEEGENTEEGAGEETEETKE